MVGIINTSVTQQYSVSNPTQTQQTQNSGREEFSLSEQESNTPEAQETQQIATSAQDTEETSSQTEQDEQQFAAASNTDFSALSSEDAERGSLLDISV